MISLFQDFNLDRKAVLIGLALATVVLEIGVLYAITPADPDIYGHVTFGKEILKRGTLLQTDVYSYTAGSTYWINHEWLSEVLFAGVWLMAGFEGLHWLKTLFLGLYFYCFYLTFNALLDRVSPLTFLFFSGLFGLVLYPFLFVRPQIITFLLTQLLVLILLEYFETASRGVYALPLLFVIWTNAHGGFIAGLGLLFLTWVVLFFLRPQQFGEFSLVGGLSLLGTLINPYGYYIYHQLFRTFSNPYTNRIIQDWQSAFSWQMMTHPVIASICLVFFVYVYFFLTTQRTDRRTFLFILTVVCFLVGLKDVRNMIFVALIGLPALAELVPDAGLLEIKPSRGIVVTVIAVLGLTLASGGYFKTNPDGYFPEDSVQYIQSRNLSGNLAVPFNYGQYCIFHLYPRMKVSLDGRYNTVYPLKVFEDFELKAFQGIQWKPIFHQYGTDYALVPKNRPLHQKITDASGVRRLFTGPNASVYELSAGKN